MGIIHNLFNMYLLDTNAEANRLQMPVSGKHENVLTPGIQMVQIM